MKKNILANVHAVVLLGIIGHASAQSFYVAGEINNWDPQGTAMSETSLGSGLWTATVSANIGQNQFKITDGDWNSFYRPQAGNSWFYAPTGGSVTITYNSKTVNDGWSGSNNRIGVSVDPGSWNAFGDWQGWNMHNPETIMSPIGNGIYGLAYTITTPGTYLFAAVCPLTDYYSIGTESYCINWNYLSFTTTQSNEVVGFYVNPSQGVIKVEAVPEPSTYALFGLGALALVIAYRRKVA